MPGFADLLPQLLKLLGGNIGGQPSVNPLSALLSRLIPATTPSTGATSGTTGVPFGTGSNSVGLSPDILSLFSRFGVAPGGAAAPSTLSPSSRDITQAAEGLDPRLMMLLSLLQRRQPPAFGAPPSFPAGGGVVTPRPQTPPLSISQFIRGR